MDTQTLVLVGAVVLVVVVVVLVAVLLVRRRRTTQRVSEARRRFGAEFDHTAEEVGSDRKAVDVLEERAERRKELDVRDLSEPDTVAVRTNLARLQYRFVDEPAEAVAELGRVVAQVLRAQGYPMGEDHEEGLRLFAVDHPEAAQRLRPLLTGDHGHDASTQRERFLAGRETLREVLGVTYTVNDAAPGAPTDPRTTAG